MKNPICTVAALALIVGAGLLHGAWTNRWRTAPALAELAARLESVPAVLGDWTATSRAIPPTEVAMTGAVGHISRVYTNPKGSSCDPGGRSPEYHPKPLCSRQLQRDSGLSHLLG